MADDHGQRLHARISASSLKRRQQCPGSLRMEAGKPNKDSKFSLDGTAKHMAVDHCLETGCDPKTILGMSFKGIVMDRAAVDLVTTCVDFAKEIIEPGCEWAVEQSYDLGHLYPGWGGIGDLVVYNPRTEELWSVDWKAGVGVPVEVAHNPQVRTYALGALFRYHNRPVKRIRCVIVQPACPHPEGPIREEVLELADLMDWAFEAVDFIKATQDPTAPLEAGSECQFCKAGPTCPKLYESALAACYAVITEQGDLELTDPTALTESQLAAALKQATLIKMWVKHVEAHAFDRAMAGLPVEGHKLVEKRATRKWANEVEAKEALVSKFGLAVADIMSEPELLSPAKVEKLLPKAERGDLFSLMTKEGGELTLALLSDRRPAVSPPAQAQFDEIEDF